MIIATAIKKLLSSKITSHRSFFPIEISLFYPLNPGFKTKITPKKVIKIPMSTFFCKGF